MSKMSKSLYCTYILMEFERKNDFYGALCWENKLPTSEFPSLVPYFKNH